MAIERRTLPAADVEMRVSRDADGVPTIEGTAAVYRDLSDDLGGFRERIMPGAFREAIKADGLDVRALFNHNPDYVLGRTTTGSLKLKNSKEGLTYTVTPTDTTISRDVCALVESGDVSGCSFAFTVASEGDRWVEEDGAQVREITRIGSLLDVGPVTYPAYPTTDVAVALRSLDKWKAEHDPLDDTESDQTANTETIGPDVVHIDVDRKHRQRLKEVDMPRRTV